MPRIAAPFDEPLLERGESIGRLRALLAEAQLGHGQIAVVTGEAGVGKSALLRAFEAAMPQDVEVLHGYCEDLSISEPLGPLRDMARDAGWDAARLLGGTVDRLSVFSEVLAHLAGSGQVTVLLVEDLHWADEATLEFLRFIARRVHDLPVLLITTSRDDENQGRPNLRRAFGGLSSTRVARLALAPLSSAAVAILSANAGARSTEIFRLTGGNAFYVTEILRGDQASGSVTVQDAVLSRVDRLAPQDRALLEAVSIFPRRAEIVWATVLDGRPGEANIKDCLASGLLNSDGSHLAFRHEIARQAVEAALTPLRRKMLNERLLALLQGATAIPFARRLHHARECNDAAAIAALAPQAGREAAAAGAHLQASEYFELALSAAQPEDADELATLLSDAALEHTENNAFALAVKRSDQALQLRLKLNDRLRAGDLMQRISLLHQEMGQMTLAETVGDRVIELLSGTQSAELAMAYASRAKLAMLQRDVELADNLGEAAVDLARQVGRLDIEAHALCTLGLNQWDAERALGLFGQSLQLALDQAHIDNIIRVYACRGWMEAECLRYSSAIADYDMAIAYGQKYDRTFDLPFEMAWRLEILSRMGRWEEAAAGCAALIAGVTEKTSVWFIGRIVLASLATRRGDQDASRYISELIEFLPQDEDWILKNLFANLMAERAWLGLETIQEARKWMDHARAISKTQRQLQQTLTWQKFLEPERDIAIPEGTHRVYRFALEGNWRAAATEWERMGAPYSQALALLEGGAEAVQKALAILDHLGASAVASRVRKNFLTTEATPPSRGPRSSTLANPGGLTRRQLQVLELLNAGKSNAEIAGRLFLSAKTVDHHVSAILAKLDVASRSEAAAMARKAGWLSDSS